MKKETSVIKTDSAEIWLENKQILWVRILEGAEMDLKAMEKCFSIYSQFLGKKKTVQIIDARAVCTMTTEGKQYSALHSPDYLLATAVITDQLSVRLLTNFYNKLHNHSVPFELFKTEEEARAWLKPYIR